MKFSDERLKPPKCVPNVLNLLKVELRYLNFFSFFLRSFSEECAAIMQNHVTSLLVVLLLLCSCTGIQSLDTALVPLFTQSVYNATIYENSAAKTYVESLVKMGIYITDPTWEMRYKIVSGDNENLFKAEDYQLGDFSFLRIRTKGGVAVPFLTGRLETTIFSQSKPWKRIQC